MRVYNNIAFKNNQGLMLKKNFFLSGTYENESKFEKITKLRFKDLLDDNLKPISNFNTLNQKLELDLSYTELVRLYQIMIHNFDNYKHLIPGSQFEISQIVHFKNAKSKYYRSFLVKNNLELKDIPTVSNRYGWCEINFADSAREMNFQNVWQKSFLPLSIRDYSLRFINNKEKLNIHLFKSRYNVFPACSFCAIDNDETENRETIEHFYNKCDTVREFSKSIFENYFPDVNFDISWLLIGAPSNLSSSLIFIINIEIFFINFFLYNFQNSRCLPTLEHYNRFMSWYRIFMLKNERYKTAYYDHNFPFDNG